MPKIILIRLVIILIVLCGLTVINLQAQTQTQDSVTASRSTAVVSNNDCEAELKTANQRLEKTLDALENAESLNKSLQNEINALRRLAVVNDEIIKAKEEVIAEQKKLIEILRKQSRRKVSIAFGLFKFYY